MSCPHGNPIGGCDTCDEVDAAFEAGKRSALAEQPAQQQMPDDWFNGMPEEYRRAAWRIKEQPAPMIRGDIRDGLVDDEPAQQEPVATDWERIARVQDAKLRAMCNEPGGFERLCEVMDRYERTSPPASKPWVGLTEEDIGRCFDAADGTMGSLIAAIEAKLKEKNNG